MKTVAIIEGFAGGPMLTKRFRKALTGAGFKVIKNRSAADIIVAHSAGIYSIPSDAEAKVVLLIGPTYWPGVRLVKRVCRSNLAVGRYHIATFGWRSFSLKKLLEAYYFFRRHKYLWLGLLNNNRLDRLNRIIRPGRNVILIRNSEDTFTSPGIKMIAKAADARYVELPGVHDDFMTNPQPYIDLLLKNI